MKRLTFLFAFLLVGLSTFAQKPAEHRGRGERLSPEERKEKMLTEMIEDLALTAKQQRNVKAILDDAHVKLEKLKEQNRPEMEAMKAEMKEAKTKYKNDREQLFAAVKEIKEKHSTDINLMREKSQRIKAESKLDILNELNRKQQIEFLMKEDKKHKKSHGMKDKRGLKPRHNNGFGNKKH